MKTIFNFSIFFLLLTILFIVTACGTQSNNDIPEEDIDLCRNSAFADFNENYYEIDYEPWLTEGNTTKYDSNLNFLVLGYEKEGPDKEPHGGITLIYDTPDKIRLLGETVRPEQCLSYINSATLSTNDVRVGTGEELNGKLYSLVNPSTTGNNCNYTDNDDIRDLPPNWIEFFYVSRDIAHGWFCVELQQVSPENGEPFTVGGYFTIRN